MGADHSSAKANKDRTAQPVRFDHFHVRRAIGRGSFGKVCIVQKKDNKCYYAMKYTNKLKCIEKNAFNNILKEIEILVTLNHPFLVNLWFTFQDEEDLFMVFDLLLGGDIRYHLNQDGRFAEDRVKLYVCELALALDYLQQKRILHRDVKADNVVLDDAGHCHLTDFNVATHLPNNSLATTMAGTKPYIACEIYKTVIHECSGYSFAVDWWSLGVCMYEMLRGCLPFDINCHMSYLDVRSILQSTTITIPVEWSDDLVDFLCVGLLNADPCRRISSLNAFFKHSYMERIKPNDVLRKRMVPVFTPSHDCLNCDPTYELEEMIIEPRPLHKKKKRTRTSKSNAADGTSDPITEALDQIEREFKQYNREEMLRDEDKRLRKLEEELEIRPPLEEDAASKILGRIDEEPTTPTAAAIHIE